jgi:hypothetical protein
LFPDRYRALVLDGPVDAAQYIHAPLSSSQDQAAAFERALQRFLQACAGDQTACSRFGGADPGADYDRLIATAEATPIPAAGYTPDPRPVTADDIRGATLALLYAKQFWGILGQALASAAQGDATIIRAAVDQLFYGRLPDGTYDPLYDRLFTISGSEQDYPRDIDVYLARGAESWAAFPHFWGGYGEIRFALWPKRDGDAYGGPFTVPASSPTPLVVATTYDPATPYPGARRLVQELGNARLLTMVGDGHTAFGQGNSACVDGAVVAYLVDTTLPAAGTTCQQEVAFSAPQGAPSSAAARTAVPKLLTPVRAGVLGTPAGR